MKGFIYHQQPKPELHQCCLNAENLFVHCACGMFQAGVTLTGAEFDSDLPSWARVSPDQPTRFIDTTQQEAGTSAPITQTTTQTIPQDSDTTTSSLGADSKDTNQLPNWAKRALEKSESDASGAGGTVPGGTVRGADPKPHVSDSSLGDVMYGDAGQEVMTRLLNKAIGKKTQKTQGGSEGKSLEVGGGQSVAKQVQDAVITRAEDSTIQNLIYGDGKDSMGSKGCKESKDDKNKTHGSAKDSTVQNLIYGDSKESKDVKDVKDVKEEKSRRVAEDSTTQNLIHGDSKGDTDDKEVKVDEVSKGAEDSTVQNRIYGESTDEKEHHDDRASGDVTRVDTGDSQAVISTSKPAEKLSTSDRKSVV